MIVCTNCIICIVLYVQIVLYKCIVQIIQNVLYNYDTDVYRYNLFM